ncbi:unnamed protein product [Linum tenue]|uniref:3-hydroxyisobutyryl-CoA hydrolase n=1 Tax=Linum tenue TaxID=586396 RepID=A0AAV0J4L1_9ROSI|nr:unnamed protein product [Linum tenue]
MKGLKVAAGLLARLGEAEGRSFAHARYRDSYRGICSLASSISKPIDDDDLQSQVLVEGKAQFRTAILNRPSVLNALNLNMGSRLNNLYTSWEDDPDIGFVAMKGSGRAFCAGGDMVAVYHLLNQGKREACKDFFATLYQFIYLLGTYLKPQVALLNGVTMGGGAGVSIPSTFRLATERTIFATPETLLGFHPDAGASFYLSHLPGHLGEYLALTGETLNGVEMIGCGLATHYTHSTKFRSVEERLGNLITDDPSVIETSLEEYGDLVHPDSTSVIHRIEAVDKCFSHDTVEEIIDALIRDGRLQTLDQCLVREYRMSLQGMAQQDLREGVRARLVDKDLAPKWNPPRLGLVTEGMVDQYFSLLDGERDLELPIQQREAFT